MKFRIFCILLLIVCSLKVHAQEKRVKSSALSGPEKRWVLTHICKARKAQKISEHVLILTDSILKNNILDGDANGGQVDAFRHITWLALLTQRIGPNASRRLGNAHEKGNYKSFLKNRFEDGSLADQKAGMMDYDNNELGIRIGRENNKKHSESSILEIIIWTIRDGQATVIKKNQFGRSLDMDGKVIPDQEWMGVWENDRCLVPSDFIRL